MLINRSNLKQDTVVTVFGIRLDNINLITRLSLQNLEKV